jgi:transposase
MIRMLLVGYCYGIRRERRLCQEVALHLAYRWFCKLDLDDKCSAPFDILGEPARPLP